MDPTERLVTQIIRSLVENGIIVKTAHRGYVLAYGLSLLVGSGVEYLLQLLFSAGRRIMNAIRMRNPDNSIVAVIFREIIAMSSECMDVITEAIIVFLRKLVVSFFERGANFAEELGQRSLEFTSVSSHRRNQ
nr:uncharacterized protein LOC106683970 [Halyomorpha halys]